MTPLQRAIALDYEISDRLSQRSFRNYLQRVVIDSRPKPRRFGDVAESWQWDRVSAIEGAIEHVAGFRPDYAGPKNIWLGYSKGHDKTSFIARTFNWLLGYSRNRLKIYACASDADQAKLIRDAMTAERDLNPFLKKRVQVLMKAAWGRGGSLEILASDADSGQGKLPSCVVFDELSHWRNKEFFDAIYSARNKRPDCVVIVLTNAGFVGSWAHELREIARTSPRWHFFEQPVGQQLASWMDEAAILEDAKMLLPTEFRRLIRNEWIDLSEESGLLTRDEVNQAVDYNLKQQQKGTRGFKYFASIDYGPKKDRTVITVEHREPDGKVLTDHLECWHRPGGTVLVDEVEAYADKLNQAFFSPTWTIDGYQMEGTIQRFESKGYKVNRFEPRGGKSNYELASNLRYLIASGRFKWYPGAGRVTLPRKYGDPAFVITEFADDTLEKELSSLVIKLTAAGFRLDHVSNKHDDRAVGLGMSALAIVNEPLLPPLPAPTPVQLPPRDFRNLPFAADRGPLGLRQ